MSQKIVTLLSGGLDSQTLLYYLATQFKASEITAVSFDYGQRHGQRELSAANEIIIAAQERFVWRVDHVRIDLRSLSGLLDGSALTDRDIEVPEGHYAAENMKLTVVPNRNMMMLAIAASIAVSKHATILAFGAHAGDHAIYPDCRPVFVDVMNLAIKLGNDGFVEPTFSMFAPFIHQTKTDIVKLADEMDVPFGLSWSCYKGRRIQCGACGTCFERREAFRDAKVPDPTEYESTPEFAAP